MRTIITTLAVALLAMAQSSFAQKTVTVTVDDEDISNNLDLYGIAYVFGESEDLADFEARINSADAQISNLDLNNDGEVDYLRVVEAMEGNMHVVVVQAVLAKDLYQDVATIVVDKETTSKSVSVQIVGDPYIYGENYIIEPVYVTVPVIYTYFWRPVYHCYVSPYYWGYYPSYFHYRPCIHVNVYLHHMHRYRRAHYTHMSFHYADKPRYNYGRVHATISHNDYAVRYPNNSFSVRNNGATNRRVVDAQRVSGNSARTPVNSRTSSSASAASSRGGSVTSGRVSTSRTATTGSTVRTNSTSSRTNSVGTRTNSTSSRTNSVGTRANSGSTRTNSSSTRTGSSNTRKSSVSASPRQSSAVQSSATRSSVSTRQSATSSSSRTATRSSSASVRKSSGTSARSSSATRSSGSTGRTSSRSSGSSR